MCISVASKVIIHSDRCSVQEADAQTTGVSADREVFASKIKPRQSHDLDTLALILTSDINQTCLTCIPTAILVLTNDFNMSPALMSPYNSPTHSFIPHGFHKKDDSGLTLTHCAAVEYYLGTAREPN